jgi:uncharacterized protein YukE
MKVAGAVITMIANGFKGAAESFSAWVKKVAQDAKAKVLFAVSQVRSWFAVKADAVAKWVSETYDGVKKEAIEAWNSLSGAAIKAWKDACDKFDEFINNVKATMDEINQKIKDFAEDVKQGAISLKDAGAAKIISKTVKALNKDNYPLDKVIDLVTKAYNESLFIQNNKVMLNESAFNRKARVYMRRLNG